MPSIPDPVPAPCLRDDANPSDGDDKMSADSPLKNGVESHGQDRPSEFNGTATNGSPKINGVARHLEEFLLKSDDDKMRTDTPQVNGVKNCQSNADSAPDSCMEATVDTPKVNGVKDHQRAFSRESPDTVQADHTPKSDATAPHEHRSPPASFCSTSKLQNGSLKAPKILKHPQPATTAPEDGQPCTKTRKPLESSPSLSPETNEKDYILCLKASLLCENARLRRIYVAEGRARAWSQMVGQLFFSAKLASGSIDKQKKEVESYVQRAIRVLEEKGFSQTDIGLMIKECEKAGEMVGSCEFFDCVRRVKEYEGGKRTRDADEVNGNGNRAGKKVRFA